jgi:hypothetical protein
MRHGGGKSQVSRTPEAFLSGGETGAPGADVRRAGPLGAGPTPESGKDDARGFFS